MRRRSPRTDVYFLSARMIFIDLPVANSQSRVYARQLFRCSIVYLPLLFVLMMSNALKSGQTSSVLLGRISGWKAEDLPCACGIW